MNEENKVIGKRIRNKREQQGLSREKLSELANISSQFLADIETGKKGMTVSTLKKICSALYISSDEIVFGREKSSGEFTDEIISMITNLNTNQQTELCNIIRSIIKLTLSN